LIFARLTLSSAEASARFFGVRITGDITDKVVQQFSDLADETSDAKLSAAIRRVADRYAEHEAVVSKKEVLSIRIDNLYGFGHGGAAITPDGKHAYVATDGAVAVITTATGRVATAIPVGGVPAAVAICPARSAHKRR